jgi:hypothetical protein
MRVHQHGTKNTDRFGGRSQRPFPTLRIQTQHIQSSSDRETSDREGDPDAPNVRLSRPRLKLWCTGIHVSCWLPGSVNKYSPQRKRTAQYIHVTSTPLHCNGSACLLAVANSLASLLSVQPAQSEGPYCMDCYVLECCSSYMVQEPP